ncbi:MAG TPA: SDR family NAD(P)-dependent oxidoreductase, partial [Mucilaginibacter sp.]
MKEYALITGASKGIGKSMALLLAKQGYNLLLTARSANELSEVSVHIRSTYHVDALYFPVDLSSPGAAAQIAAWCSQRPVSILINNAGYGLWGNFETLDLAGQMSMIRVNIDALVELCYYLIPVLRLQKQAYILNVASTAAYQAVPTLAIYAATKAYVLSFSRALRYELKGSPVSVSCLCPGPTDTGFAQRAGMEALAELAA